MEAIHFGLSQQVNPSMLEHEVGTFEMHVTGEPPVHRVPGKQSRQLNRRGHVNDGPTSSGDASVAAMRSSARPMRPNPLMPTR